MNLAEAAKRAGLSTTVLRALVDEGLVPCERGRNGHPTVELENVPDVERAQALWTEHYQRCADKALAAVRRLEAELEAVRLDITEAVEHPEDPLGNDIRNFGGTSGAFHARMLAAADATIVLILAHRTLQELP